MKLASRNVVVQAFEERFRTVPQHLAKTYKNDEASKSLTILSKFLVGGSFRQFDRLVDELMEKAETVGDNVLRQTVSSLLVLRHLYAEDFDTAEKLQRNLDGEIDGEKSSCISVASLVSRISLDLYKLTFCKRSIKIEQTLEAISTLQKLIYRESCATEWELSFPLVFSANTGLSVDAESLETLRVLLTSDDSGKVVQVWKDFITGTAVWKSFFLKEIVNLGLVRLLENGRTAIPEVSGWFLTNLEKLETIYNMLSLKVPLFYVEKALAAYYSATNEDILYGEKEEIIRVLMNSMTQLSERVMEHILWRVGLLPVDSSLENVMDFLTSLILDSFDDVEGLRFVVRDAKTGTNVEVSFGELSEYASAEAEFLVSPELLHVSEDFDEHSSVMLIVGLGKHFIEKPHEQRQDLFAQAVKLEALIRSVLKSTIAYERTKYDHLTALYSRTYVDQLIERLLGEFLESEGLFSIFVLDVDFLKSVNDKYGHQFGDTVLQTIANVLKSEPRLVAAGRFGGEEFIGITAVDKESCAKICWDIKEEVKQQTSERCGLQVTVSIGVAESSEASSVTELIGLADQRLYRAKAEGRDRVVSW